MADNADLLGQIRHIIREEVEAEAKTTRQENTLRYVKLLTEVNKVADKVKDVEITGTRLEKGQQEIQGDVKALQEGQKTLQTDINSLKEGQETLELKGEVINANQQRAEEQSQKDHAEIMERLVGMVEIEGNEHKLLERRVERIEKHSNLPALK